jgi:alcohol dehydrogenase (cytochrome c)
MLANQRGWASWSFGCILLGWTLSVPPAPAQTPDQGKKTFDSRCAACHGSDANGGEFAPGIVTRIANRSDADVAGIITEGVPSRGMPAFKFDDSERASLISYLRKLKPPRGSIIPVELDVPMTDGTKLRGLSVNRTSEDMQLRTADGRVHLLRKEGARYRKVSSQVDWSSYDGLPSGNRYSTIKQINRGNVSNLKVKWIFSLADTASLEGTPLVVNGLMYVTAGNECYALDAGSGREVWHYRRQRTKGMGSKANRGAAISGDRVFLATDNAHLIALNRFSGALLWDVEMADAKQNYFTTSAPLIAGNLVVCGMGGGDSGVRGFLSAYDVTTGKKAWRFWTIPQAGEPGSETWKGSNLLHAGGATWFTGSYDPESKLLFWQVGNPGPDHDADEREGDNLYSDSVIALEPATGKLKWHYQFTPHDVWDWDAPEPLVLADTNWRGRQRKVLMQANRNGFFYVLDRTDGKLLLARPFIKKLTWAREIGADGRPVRVPNQEPSVKGTKVCPAVLGGTNWWSASFEKSTDLFYVLAIESCSIFVKESEEWKAGHSYMGGNSRTAPSDPPVQYVRAIDINTGKIAWETPQAGSGDSRSGTMATAGGLVFFGDDTGAVAALDSATGRPLWSFQTSQALRASPMTYVFDNRQMVALASGSNILAFGLP